MLIVVFGSCPRKGIKSRYNYVRTLKDIYANKLFILDEYGEDGRGCYYLGHNRDFTIRDNVIDLIDYIIEQTNAKTILYCGSSKGGWSALYFGLMRENSFIIAGAPQYLLENYFLAVPDVRLEEYVFGENWTNEDIEALNGLVRNELKSNRTCQIYLHYSDAEHTYEDNVRYLINDLEKFQYPYHVNIMHYREHNDVGIWFSRYMYSTVKSIASN